jgi:hypothetical protein
MGVMASVVAVGVMACGGSRNAGAPGSDGGATPPDAAHADTGDGGTHDAGDAGVPPDAFIGGDATVIVFGNSSPGLGQPQAGIPVMFHTHDGRLITTVLTDRDGKAIATIPPDASVTIVCGLASGAPTMLTRTNVQPGAVVKLGFRGRVPKTLATLTVSWTTPPGGGAGHFDVVTPCGGAFADFRDRGATFSISDDCADTAFPVYVIGRQNADFINQSGVEGVTATNGATISIPLTTWLGPTDVTSNVTHVPNNVVVSGQLEQAVRGLSFDNALAGGLSVGDSVLTYHMAPSPGSELREQIDLSDIGGTPVDQVIARRQPFGGNFSLDLGAALLPSFTAAGFDLPSRTWTWSTRAPIAPDIQLLYLSYRRPDFRILRWNVIAPAAIGNSFVLPEIPASLAEIAPLATDTISGAVSELKLGNGLTFAQVQDDLDQWLTLIPHLTLLVNWRAAPAALDTLVETNATF